MYAEHHIATFPVGGDKRPLVRGYQNIGLNGSAELAGKFSAADAIAFMAGRRSGIAVCDIDTADEHILSDALTRHGPTPLIARTASGKFHAYYRHNGERRAIRPEPEIDILGGGIVIAPGSRRDGKAYEFIAGCLDDLERLPVMRNVPARAQPGPALVPDECSEIAPTGRRNVHLWGYGMRALADHTTVTHGELLAFAHQQNAQTCVPPLSDNEVMHIVNSAWKRHQEGRNWFGRPAMQITSADILPLMPDADVGMLYLWAKATNKLAAEFWLADGLAVKFGWTLYRFREARRRAVEAGLFRRIRGATTNHPALYVFGNDRRARARESEERGCSIRIGSEFRTSEKLRQ
jgi:hypothetical protein